MQKRTLHFIIIGAIVLALAALITVVVLLINQSKQPSETSMDQTVNAAFIIDLLPEQSASSESFENYLVAQQPSTQDTLYVKSSDLNSLVSVPAELGLAITNKDNTPISSEQLTSLEKSITETVQGHGVTKLNAEAPSGTIAIYTSSTTTCNLEGVAGATQVTFVCVDNSNIKSRLITISDLIKIWGSDKSHPYITATVAESDDKAKALYLLMFSNTDNSIVASPLYKKDGSTWEFITDTSPQQDQNSAGGKAVTSPLIEELSKDQTYGPLTQKIFATSNN